MRFIASDRDGEALAALRRAARLMERLELDWDALVRAAPPSAEVLARALALGRASGLRDGRAEAERARERAYAEGLAAGRALARAEAGGSRHGHHGQRDASVLAAVVRLDRRRGAATGPGDGEAEDRRLIAAVLDNPQAPARTVAFVADLRRWLDARGSLTPAQGEALRRTHQRWGQGAA